MLILNDTIKESSYNYDVLTVAKDYKLFAVKYVKTYCNKTAQTWDIDVDTDTATAFATAKEAAENPQYYFVLDTWEDEAFAHWIYESAIYLRLFSTLKGKFPNIKLVLRARRDYKNLFIKYYNISTQDVVYEISTLNNVCLFHSPISMLHDEPLNDKFKLYVYRFINDMNTIKNKPQKKDIDILLMPRQKKENLKGNDRINDASDIEEALAKIPSISTALLHTDDITDINEQIKTVRRAKNLIVTDGSPFLVNGIFCMDTNIVVLGNLVCSQGARFKKLGFVKETIEERNKVTFMPYVHGHFHNCKFLYNDIKEHLKFENKK
jgi:hypothetical protein